MGLPILDPDEVRTSELEDIAIEILKTEKTGLGCGGKLTMIFNYFKPAG